jgi:transcriptional regulator with XRE-family HTH domain
LGVNRGPDLNVAVAEQLNALVGANVRRLRHCADFTREELASRASVDWTYLGAIERGRRNPSVAILARLAAALGVEPSAFFCDESRLSQMQNGTSRTVDLTIA